MRYILIFSAFFLSSCATTPVPASQATPAPVARLLAFQSKPEGPSGTIIVTRDEGILGSGCFYSIQINGILAARLAVREKASFFVEPGEIVLRSGRDPLDTGLCALNQDEWTQRETIIHENEIKYFRLSIDTNAKTDIQRSIP